jgi:hypothetical protein
MPEFMGHVCDPSCAHTINVGYVHTPVEPGGPCRPFCPHPDHTAEERLLWAIFARPVENEGQP